MISDPISAAASQIKIDSPRVSALISMFQHERQEAGEHPSPCCLAKSAIASPVAEPSKARRGKRRHRARPSCAQRRAF